MTLKLFNSILTICLAFGSLNLQAEQIGKAAPASTSLQSKKSPQAYFIESNTCLKHAEISCARLALAKISSTSPYAKLLQGSIALTEQQVDKSLLLLLPLQTEKDLIAEAKVSLHQYLAKAFESLDDPLQVLQHLMQAESAMANPMLPDQQNSIAINHDKIWSLLSKLDQAQLIGMRGEITDSDSQGWIDLSLAARNQDPQSSLASWRASYADHPAQAFAKKLPAGKNSQAQTGLPPEVNITLLFASTDEANSDKGKAFQQGLQASLAKRGLHNAIKIHTPESDPQDLNEQPALAKNEASTYFVAPDFNADKIPNTDETDRPSNQDDAHPILHVGMPLNDEAERIAGFAISHGMQHIAIVTTESEISKRMVANFRAAWTTELGITDDSDTLNIVTLAGDASSFGTSLLDLKVRIAAKPHDMLLLVMPAPDARAVRPYLDISTPTMAFSNVHAFADDAIADTALNAVRFPEVPFLLITEHDTFADYRTDDTNLTSNELLRWFALGVDTLELIIAARQPASNGATINGLTGTLTIDKSGKVKRQLSIARFTHNGIVPER